MSKKKLFIVLDLIWQDFIPACACDYTIIKLWFIVLFWDLFLFLYFLSVAEVPLVKGLLGWWWCSFHGCRAALLKCLVVWAESTVLWVCKCAFDWLDLWSLRRGEPRPCKVADLFFSCVVISFCTLCYVILCYVICCLCFLVSLNTHVCHAIIIHLKPSWCNWGYCEYHALF